LVYALHHANAPETKINIGQGFIGKAGEVALGASVKEKATAAVRLFEEMAEQRGVSLKLRKK
jgi:hypothetical protein